MNGSTRRTFLSATLLLPAASAASRTWSEIEKILASAGPSGRLASGRLAKEELPTPALVLDLDLFEANVRKMADHARRANRALRPHAKTHKCAAIARYLIREGAVGACAAKISEAEALARDGVTGLLLTTAMVGRTRIERAIALARRRPETIFVVDNAQNAADLDEAARASRVTLNVALDLLVGQRTGIPAGKPALGLAQAVMQLKNLRLAGLQAYSGNASHVQGFAERRAVSRDFMGRAVETRQLLESQGIPCPWLSGGSTGTYNIDSEIDGVTELQPGSYVFMDQGYNGIGGADGNPRYSDFANSLTVVATVYSKPDDRTAIVDAGLKSFATDSGGVPRSISHPAIPYSWAGDEHGRLDLATGAGGLNLGDRVEFTVPHCDPTVNLYDRIFCTRQGMVEAVWRVTARGMLQ